MDNKDIILDEQVGTQKVVLDIDVRIIMLFENFLSGDINPIYRVCRLLVKDFNMVD